MGETMKKRIALILTAAIALSSHQAALANSRSVPEIIVKYKSSAPISIMSTELGVLEGRNIYKYKPGDMAEYNSMMESLSNNLSVAYAEPVVKFSLMQTPSDPDLEYNWGHQAVGAYEAWDITTGSGAIKVAVIDTGVDGSDPDLQNRLIPGYDFVNGDDDPDNADVATHGTLVSKIIGAEAENTVEGEVWGTVGMAWECGIMPLKVFDDNNPDKSGSSDIVAEAIYYAAENGADIINMSLGGPEQCQVVKEAMEYANENGILIIVSSGNSGDGIMYPAAYQEAMSVGAFGQGGEIEDYSCRGKEMSITAPGQILASKDQSGQTISNGTSFSAPYVSGAAVLLKSMHASWTPSELRWALENSATDAGEAGWDNIYGKGRLNAFEALNLQSPPPDDGNDSISEKEALQMGDNIGKIQVPLDKDYYGLTLEQTTTVKINGITPVPISLNDSIERWPAGDRVFEVGALYGRWSAEPYTISVESVPYGDFDGNRRVDIYDMVRLAKRKGSDTGTEQEDSIWDGNLDGNIDMDDINQAAAIFGETY